LDPLSLEEAEKVAEQLNYRHNGLILVVVHEASSRDILMVAFANKEAVKETLTTGLMHYWSTERKSLWKKGETSGHYQFLEELYVDCDLDAIFVKVRQVDGACHLGYKTCFFRKLKNTKFEVMEAERR